MDLEEVWRRREEEVYPALFGPLSRGIFPLPAELFVQRFRQTEIDPRWLTMGVLEFGPTAERPSWLYITSGYSNPWHQEPADYDPEGESGSGIEFAMQTAEQAEWAIPVLASMLAFDVLLSAGRLPSGAPLSLYDRIPYGAPVTGEEGCVLTNLILAPAEGMPDSFVLPSGKAHIAAFTAVSDAELELARNEGTKVILDRLREAGHHPVVRPERASIV
ncbi:MAG: suppressor of fused domain protein [Caulobacter sp.]|nr:suppressor of fused domain protein [Caulobacter sp.]